MDAELAAGFAAVIVSLVVIALVVFVSRGSIEKTHRKSLAGQQQAAVGTEDDEEP